MASSVTLQRTVSPQATCHDQLTVTFLATASAGLAPKAVFVFQTGGADLEREFICVATRAQLSEVPAYPTADAYGPAEAAPSPITTGAAVDGCATCSPAAPWSSAYVRKASVQFVVRRTDDIDEITAELTDRVEKLCRELDAGAAVDSTMVFVSSADGTEVPN